MTEESIIAGFGGQGVLTIGMVLAYAGMVENKEVSWMPSYGPEMRGGTANCSVIVSDDEVTSPIISKYDSAIILNQPSLDKFEKTVKPGGLLIYEANNIINPPTRTDITIQAIPAAVEADKMNMAKAMNMIMLGAFLEHRPILTRKAVMAGLAKVLPERYHHLLPKNEEAMECGANLARRQKELT